MSDPRAPVIGLLGAGNIAAAMVEGWVGRDPAMAERILVTDRGSGRAAALAQRHGVRHVASNHDLVAAAGIVVLCVKPVDVERVLRDVSELVTGDKTIASVAAGVRIATLETILDVDAPVFRLMPNVGVTVGAGTLAFSAGRFTDTTAEQRVLEAFSMLGEVVPLEERLFDAATALSGSGPAFLGLILEAFEDAGIVSGLTPADARRLLLSTVSGTT
ncbi:MAG TPA: pyrroline-5-carboxylate reductase, partial [Gaiellales bacterium]|nr:pyrroline-5-carboxylate reductase [Gaiellales bacterium]